MSNKCPYISLRICSHAGVMLPDYWQGSGSPHLSFPVRDGMTLNDVKEALRKEANDGNWCGSMDYEISESDEFHNRAMEAIDGMTLLESAQDGAIFDGLIEYDEGPDLPMAYFVFH